MKSSDNEKINPRTSRVRRVILDSAIELFFEHGATAVTAARVAEATGVARTTIYRQWPDQPSLVLATIDAMVSPGGDPPDTGKLKDDLTTALTQLRTRLVKRPVRPVVAALMEHASRDRDFALAQRRFVEGIVSQVVAVFEYAQERGDLHADLDLEVAAATVAGPLLYRHLLVHDKIADTMIDQLVSQFMETHATTAD